MSTGQLAYLSYLLRLWRASGGDSHLWRASLEDPLTGERTGFSDLEALIAFLLTQIEEHPLPGGEPGDRGKVN